MKKLLIILIGCLILGACLTPQQRRERFEQEMPKPVFDCGNVEEMPTDVSLSEEEIAEGVAKYDYEDCGSYQKGMRPIQQINSREFLAYLCGPIGCNPSYIYHVKLPYSVQQLGVNAYYKFPEDICVSSKEAKPYSYTTQSGLKNTVYSVNFIKVKLASKTKRQQWINNLKNKKLEKLQKDWREEHDSCLYKSSEILKEWETNNNAISFCERIESIRKRCPYVYLSYNNSGCRWGSSDRSKYQVFELYFQNKCARLLGYR